VEKGKKFDTTLTWGQDKDSLNSSKIQLSFLFHKSFGLFSAFLSFFQFLLLFPLFLFEGKIVLFQKNFKKFWMKKTNLYCCSSSFNILNTQFKDLLRFGKFRTSSNSHFSFFACFKGFFFPPNHCNFESVHWTLFVYWISTSNTIKQWISKNNTLPCRPDISFVYERHFEQKEKLGGSQISWQR
jgi:hypothetical protein